MFSDKQISLRTTLLFVALSITVSFFIKFHATDNFFAGIIGFSDVRTWYSRVEGPSMPYINTPIEYPVIIGLIAFSTSRADIYTYLFLNYLLLLSCGLIATYYLYKLWQERGLPQRNLILLWIFAPSLIWFSYLNWDMIAVMCTVLALYHQSRDRTTLATIFLTLGFMTKFYPILLVPIFLLGKPASSWIKSAAASALTFLICNGYFMATHFWIWFAIYGFHGVRPPNIDNVWFMINGLFPFMSTSIINVTTLVLFATAYITIIWRYRADTIRASLLVLLAFIALNKVLSPQYFFWLLPFIVLTRDIDLRTFYALELSNLCVLFFTLYYIVSETDPTKLYYSIFFVILRQVIVVYFITQLVRSETKPQKLALLTN